MTLLNDISNKIKKLRTERNMSQKVLAKLLNVDHTTISRWENGSRQISLANLVKIAEIFGKPIEYFLYS